MQTLTASFFEINVSNFYMAYAHVYTSQLKRNFENRVIVAKLGPIFLHQVVFVSQLSIQSWNNAALKCSNCVNGESIINSWNSCSNCYANLHLKKKYLPHILARPGGFIFGQKYPKFLHDLRSCTHKSTKKKF